MAKNPNIKRFFARVWDAFFKKKSVPKVNNYRNIILEKGASGTFFDGLTRFCEKRVNFYDNFDA